MFGSWTKFDFSSKNERMTTYYYTIKKIWEISKNIFTKLFICVGSR